MIGDIYFQFHINYCNNVTAKKTQIKKWLSLKSIGLGESDLDYNSGNVVCLKLICIGCGESDLDYDGGNVVHLKSVDMYQFQSYWPIA